MKILTYIIPLRWCCNHDKCVLCHYWKLVDNDFDDDACLVPCALYLDVFTPAQFKIFKIHLRTVSFEGFL